MNATNSSQSAQQTYSLSAFAIFTIVAQVVIIVTAVLGNFLVCLAICWNKVLRSSATNCFILSLTFSDLLTASLCMPFDLEQVLTGWTWSHGEVLCQVWTTIYLIAVPSSILSLLAVSVDRFKALGSDPLNCSLLSSKRARMMAVALWVYTITFALIPTMGWKEYDISVHRGQCKFNITASYSIISSVVNFLVPMLIMCSLYLRIYTIVRRFSKLNMRRSLCHPSRGSIQHRQEMKAFRRSVKATRNIVIIVCVFFVCWMPFTLTSLAINLCGERCLQNTSQELLQGLLLLGYLNSALNPPLYSLNNRKIMNTYRCFCNFRPITERVQSPKNTTPL